MRIVSFDSIWNEELSHLLDAGLSLIVVDPHDATRRDAAMADAEVLISARFTANMGRACKNLRLLVCPAAGTELIDRSALPSGVRLVNGTGHEIPMAEYVIGCLVALRQRLLESDAALRRGQWRYGFYGGDRMLGELAGSNLGMIGFGGIGQAVASRATTLGMQCAAVTRDPKRTREGAGSLEFLGSLSSPSEVDRLVSWADQLVLCCELSPLTKGLLDARRFGLMKPDAVLVNIARGAIAVERDLYDALATKRIAGAAIDVWYQYPRASGQMQAPSAFPFHELDNVIMTPHASGWTEAAKRRRLAAMAETINQFARAQTIEAADLKQRTIEAADL
ncbi:MAG: 2-hydroxyacid dehydrogenase [Candidatus Eremiobacteraeota bacterium]|nr:2-hydroxyacid dehydrogenase [Candidatus Eremiobacteraeota bacterium]